MGETFAENQVNRVKLNTELALKEANILDESGRLTEFAVERARPAMRQNSRINNPSVIHELTKDGSNIQDWNKLTTPSVKLPSGQKIQVHFYKNRYTNEVNYTHSDFKVKGSINPFPKTRTSQSIIEDVFQLDRNFP